VATGDSVVTLEQGPHLVQDGDPHLKRTFNEERVVLGEVDRPREPRAMSGAAQLSASRSETPAFATRDPLV
jgi:hypothetical protein